MSWLAPVNPPSQSQSQSQSQPQQAHLHSQTQGQTQPQAPAQAPAQPQPRRIHQIVRLNPAHYAAYKESHAHVWPAVVAQIRQSNITDYSIAYDRESSLLFASFKYTGRDWDGDMAAMRAHEPTRRWWAMTDGFQESVNPGAVSSERGGTVGEDGRKVPGWWKECEEVFYLP